MVRVSLEYIAYIKTVLLLAMYGLCFMEVWYDVLILYTTGFTNVSQSV